GPIGVALGQPRDGPSDRHAAHGREAFLEFDVAVNAPLPRRVAPRPARLPAEERREHFLDVTAELIINDGIDAVTMEGVAAAAGVSKGLGYAYFANRNELLLALLERELQKLDRRALAGIRDA